MAQIRQTIPSAAARAGVRPGTTAPTRTSTTTQSQVQQQDRRLEQIVDQGGVGVWKVAGSDAPIYALSRDQAQAEAQRRGVKGALSLQGYVKLSESDRERLQEAAAKVGRKDMAAQAEQRQAARDKRYDTPENVRAMSAAELRRLYDKDPKTANTEAQRRGLTFEYMDVDGQRIVRLQPYRSVESESIGSLAPATDVKAGPRTDVVYDAFTGAEIPRTAATSKPDPDKVYDAFTGAEIPRTTTAAAKFAGAKGRAGVGAADPTKAAPKPEVAKSSVVSGLMLLPYRNADGTYNLQRMVESGMFSARAMREAGFTDAQITTAINAAMKANAVKSTKEITEAMKGPGVVKGEKLSDVMESINAQVEKDQTAAWREANAGFEDGTTSETAVQREARRTIVAGPGEERRWYHWPTGRTVSDEEYRQATNDGRNLNAEEYSRTASQVRRSAVTAVSSLFPVARPALPEVEKGDVTRMDWIVSVANAALFAVPFIPKGAGGAIQAGAGAVFGINAAQNWDELSTGSKALSVAASALLLTGGLYSIVQPSFKPVKVPLKDGGEAVVWSGLSVRGRPVVGVTKVPPKIEAIAEGWRPITRTETTVLGTRKMLAQMGVPDDEITKVLTTVKETKAFQGKRSPYQPKEVNVKDVAPQALDADELAIVLRRLAKSDDVQMVYGSTTIKPQLAPELRQWRKLGDIEAQLKSRVTEEQAAKLAKDIVADLNKRTPGKFSIDPDDAKRILVGGHHAVELKLSEVSKLGVETQYSLTRTGEMSWGMKVAEKPITINYPGVGKLDIMRLSESGVRKADAITRSTGAGTFAPPPHRIKDIADYYVILRTFKGAGVADEWAKLYGYDVPALLKQAAKDPPKLQVWRLTPKATGKGSPSVSIALPPDLAKVAKGSPALYRAITKPSPMVASSPAPRSPSASPAFGSPAASKAVSPALSTAASPSASASHTAGKTTQKAASAPAKVGSAPVSGTKGKTGGAKAPTGTLTQPASTLGAYAYSAPAVGEVAEESPVKVKRTAMPARGSRPLEPTGRVQWRQGAYWIMVEPPAVEGERQRNVQYSRRPFWGVRKVKGSPEETFARQGKPPREFLYEMGVTKARIHSYEKPHLRWRQTSQGRPRRRRGRVI